MVRSKVWSTSLGFLFLASGPNLAAAANPATWPTLAEAPALAVGNGKNDAAVIVGIESYLDLNPIPGAVANANAWADFLMGARKVPEDKVHVLRNKSATLEDMRKALAQAGKDVGKGGTLWVIFIGHGAPAKDGSDGVLVGFDAQLKTESLWARSLPRKELLAALSPAQIKGAKPVVILDACFSGKDASGKALVPGVQFSVPASLASLTTATILSAGAANEVAGPLPGPTSVSRPATWCWEPCAAGPTACSTTARPTARSRAKKSCATPARSSGPSRPIASRPPR